MTVRRVILPTPPQSSMPKYAGRPDLLMADICACLSGWKVILENTSRLQSAPAGQQMLATSFTTSTIATGTTTGTNLSNVMATLVQVLTDKGILSPTVSRQGNQ